MKMPAISMASGQHMAGRLKAYFPGVLIAILVALAAQFVAEHYGAPAMLMALLFGIALNFLSEGHAAATGSALPRAPSCASGSRSSARGSASRC